MTEEEMKAARRARQDIQRRLSEYRSIKQEIAQIEAQIKSLDGSPSGVNLDGMPRGSGTGDPVASIVNQRMALKEKYMEELAGLYAAQRHVEELIESLKSIERRLLRHRYIEGLSWRRIGAKMHYCREQCHNIHVRALDRLVEKEGKIDVLL